MRRVRHRLVVLVAVALLAACAGDGGGVADRRTTVEDPSAIVPLEDPPEPDLPVTVTTATGDEVTISDTSRIVPLAGSLAEIVFSLGLGDQVVGRDVAATFPEAADLPVVTEGHEVLVEAVLALRPTVILADTWVGPPEALDQLRRSDVPVVVLDEIWELAGVAPRIQEVARVLGVPEAGDALVERAETDLRVAAEGAPDLRIEGRAPRVAFLYLRGTAGVYLLGGPGSGADDLLTRLGVEDAGTAMGLDRPFTPITSEALIEARPDVLLVMDSGLESVGGREGLADIAGIAQTPAGREGRVASVEDDLLLSFGPRSGHALTVLAEGLADALDDAPDATLDDAGTHGG